MRDRPGDSLRKARTDKYFSLEGAYELDGVLTSEIRDAVGRNTVRTQQVVQSRFPEGWLMEWQGPLWTANRNRLPVTGGAGQNHAADRYPASEHILENAPGEVALDSDERKSWRIRCGW